MADTMMLSENVYTDLCDKCDTSWKLKNYGEDHDYCFNQCGELSWYAEQLQCIDCNMYYWTREVRDDQDRKICTNICEGYGKFFNRYVERYRQLVAVMPPCIDFNMIHENFAI